MDGPKAENINPTESITWLDCLDDVPVKSRKFNRYRLLYGCYRSVKRTFELDLPRPMRYRSVASSTQQDVVSRL